MSTADPKNPNPGTSLVKYAEYTDDAATEEATQFRRRSPFLKLPQGETVVRIPPPPFGRVTPKGEPTPYVTVSQHRVNVPGQQYPFKFPCPRVHYGKDCVVCRRAAQLQASPHKADQDAAYDLKPKTRHYVEVIDRADEGAGWKIWEFGPRMMEDLNALRRSKRGGNFTDPMHGFDLVITRVGTGPTDTRYSLSPDRSTTPFGNMGLLEPEARPDMAYFTRQMTDADIDTGLAGEAEADDADGAPPAQAAPQGRAPATGRPVGERQPSARAASAPVGRAVESTARPTPSRAAQPPVGRTPPSRTAGDIIEDGDGQGDDDELKL